MPGENDNDDLSTLDRGDEVKSPLDDAGKNGAVEGGDTPEGTGDDAGKGDSLGDDDETPEEKAEREAAEAEEARKKRARIPLSRHEEILNKARQREQLLLEEIEKLKGGRQTSETQRSIAEAKAKIEELQDKYEDLILDGKKDDARKVRKQIDAMREELVDFQTSVKSDAARRAAIEELTYNAQLANFESKYPALNPEHEDFDEEKTDEVASLMKAFVQSGEKRDKALAKAVKYVMGPPPEQKTSDAARILAEKRAAEARKKAAEANGKQPPSTAKVGLDSDKAGAAGEMGVDVMRLTQEKFAKLDEEALAKLRGDEV
jgi:DNA repair exonuclease SbcCD ATPase subunit